MIKVKKFMSSHKGNGIEIYTKSMGLVITTDVLQVYWKEGCRTVIMFLPKLNIKKELGRLLHLMG